jgi:hypothetical protein
LDPHLDPAVRAFAQSLRSSIFDPLRERGFPLKVLSKRLTGELEEGYSVSTLQRIAAGTRIPRRDILDNLLNLAGELAGQPLRPEAHQHLFTLYYAALRHSDEQLYEFYLALEERDALALRHQELRAAHQRVRKDLAARVRAESALAQDLAAARGELLALGTADSVKAADLAQLSGQLAAVRAAHADLQVRLGELEREREDLTLRSGTQDSDLVRLQEKLELAQDQEAEAGRELERLRAQLDREREAAELARGTAVGERDAALAQLADAQAQLGLEQREVQRLSMELEVLRVQAQEVKRRLDASERQLFALTREQQVQDAADTVVRDHLDEIMREEMGRRQLPVGASAQAASGSGGFDPAPESTPFAQATGPVPQPVPLSPDTPAAWRTRVSHPRAPRGQVPNDQSHFKIKYALVASGCAGVALLCWQLGWLSPTSTADTSTLRPTASATLQQSHPASVSPSLPPSVAPSNPGTPTGGPGTLAAGAVVNTVAVMREPTCPASAVRGTLSSQYDYYLHSVPTFTLTMTNHSQTACRINIGPPATLFKIYSAGDSATPTWTSGGCRSGNDWWVELKPAASVGEQFTWPRSTGTDCGTPTSANTAGDGTYNADILVTGWTTIPTASFELRTSVSQGQTTAASPHATATATAASTGGTGAQTGATGIIGGVNGGGNGGQNGGSTP